MEEVGLAKSYSVTNEKLTLVLNVKKDKMRVDSLFIYLFI